MTIIGDVAEAGGGQLLQLAFRAVDKAGPQERSLAMLGRAG